MNKKAIIGIATSIIAISACGETRTIVVEKTVPDTVQEETTTTEKYIPETTAWMSPEDTYIENIIYYDPSLINQFGKQWLLDLGYTSCNAIDEGMSLYDLLDMTTETGTDPKTIGFLVGEAIRNFCPENQWFIDAAGA